MKEQYVEILLFKDNVDISLGVSFLAGFPIPEDITLLTTNLLQ